MLFLTGLVEHRQQGRDDGLGALRVAALCTRDGMSLEISCISKMDTRNGPRTFSSEVSLIARTQVISYGTRIDTHLILRLQSEVLI